MELIADVLLLAAAFGAALYCHVLARRLRRLGTLESGMGGAIAVLSAQVDDLTRALNQAQASSRDSAARLDQLTRRAEAGTQRLELMIASLHDLPESDVSTMPAQVRGAASATFARSVGGRPAHPMHADPGDSSRAGTAGALPATPPVAAQDAPSGQAQAWTAQGFRPPRSLSPQPLPQPSPLGNDPLGALMRQAADLSGASPRKPGAEASTPPLRAAVAPHDPQMAPAAGSGVSDAPVSAPRFTWTDHEPKPRLPEMATRESTQNPPSHARPDARRHEGAAPRRRLVLERRRPFAAAGEAAQ